MIEGLTEPPACSTTGGGPVWPAPEWALVGPDYPQDLCIHEIVERHVAQAPDAVAVIFEDTPLTYGELNDRANRLAHYLASLGVQPEVPVALFLERSLELSIAVLALLKAGAVSVPLDPDFPRERIEFMLADSGSQLVVTESRLRHLLPTTGDRVLCIDQEQSAISRARGDNPTAGVRADNLCAYVYTSGSTGIPKAVMISHRVASRIRWSHCNAITIDHRDRTLVTTSVGYGFFLGEFSSGLMVGATAVLARPGGYHDIDYLIDVVERHRITVASFVPTVSRQFLARLKQRGLARAASLRHLVSQGEALTADLQGDLQRSLNSQLHKFYGLTEAPVAAYSNCQEELAEGRITIGRPTNMEFHLLDEHMNPVRVGEPGEIYLGGLGLARGYLNRRALTAERFVPNPFAGGRGSRLFRSGDAARWLPSGTLEFLGRGDQQIKISGIRVDTGEIEARLSSHPQVDGAIVVTWRQPSGSESLIAYYVARTWAIPTAQSLHEFLARSLPESFIPAAFVQLDTFPLLPSGKVDRRDLAARRPTPQGERGGEPRDDCERRLVSIWKAVLGAATVGIHDDFFFLGGNSLQAARMLAEIDRYFGVKLRRSTLVRARTVESLAKAIRTESTPRAHEESLQLLKAGGGGPALFLVHDGVGDTLLYLNLVHRMADELTVYGIEPHRNYRHSILHTRIPDMAGYYIQQILRAQPRGPYYLAGMCAGGTIAHEMALQLEAQGHVVAFVALFDSVAPQSVLPANFASRRSWAGFRGTFDGPDNGNRPPRSSVVARAATKLVNYAVYQATSSLNEWTTKMHFRRLRAAIDSGRPPSWYVRELPVVEVYVRAMKEYAPRRTARAPVILFRATEGEGDNEPHALRYDDPLIGWDRWIKDGPAVCPVPGGHQTMLHEPNVAVVAEQLRALLNQQTIVSQVGL